MAGLTLNQPLRSFGVGLAVTMGILFSAGAVKAQSHFDVLHTFAGGTDGAIPRAALIQATDGNFYGTTVAGGAAGLGTVFKMTPGGSVTVLHAFVGGTDGASPDAALIQASDGNFYGTTVAGGVSGRGTVFMMTSGGTLTVLHAFIGGATDGAAPHAALIQATDGNFYGTTSFGGASDEGTIFKMTPAGTITLLHTFAPPNPGRGGNDGGDPSAALIQATDGDFYGTTRFGGIYDRLAHASYGTVFKITPGGTLTILHTFTGDADGGQPLAALIQATDGNFYGTTAYSRAASFDGSARPFDPNDGGTFFRMAPDGILTTLNIFRIAGHPYGTVIQATDGNFYGTTANNLYCSCSRDGTLFKMTPGGSVTVLHAFTGGLDGASPYAPLIQTNDGTLLGMTSRGGASGLGVAFRLSNPAGVAPPTAAALDDLDGDRKTDLVVFRPANGTWYVRYSSRGYSTTSADAFQWGLPGDIPIRGDFDGDGKMELTIFRPSNGAWYIRYSSLGYSIASSSVSQWGLQGDIPVAGDFDGDGRTELAVFRPVNGTWFIRYSSLGYTVAGSDAFQWGLPGDIPIAGDFDGDGRTELAVYRPATGTWYVRYSSLGYTIASYDAFQWGQPGDVPVAGDFDGDGLTDLTVFRPSTGEWFIRYSSRDYSTSSVFIPFPTSIRILFDFFQWGLPGDVPAVADFDGDGKTELTVFRPSIGGWFSHAPPLGNDPESPRYYQWGLPGDVLDK